MRRGFVFLYASSQPAGAAQLDKFRMARLEESVRSTVADFLRLAFDAEHADGELFAARDKQAHQKEALPVLEQQYKDAARRHDKMRAKSDKCIFKAFTTGSVRFVLENAGQLFQLAEEHRPRTKAEKLAIERRRAERRRLKRRAKRIKRLRRAGRWTDAMVARDMAAEMKRAARDGDDLGRHALEEELPPLAERVARFVPKEHADQHHCLEEFDELLHKIAEKIEEDARYDWHPVVTAVKEFSEKDRRPGYKEFFKDHLDLKKRAVSWLKHEPVCHKTHAKQHLS